MQDNNRNIYQTARKSAGLTQEAAAERLAVSLTSLRAYEGGERVPAGDVVARMWEFIRASHTEPENPLFKMEIPEV